MSADQEYAGDYGYDLAHEVKAGAGGSGMRPRTIPTVGIRAVPFEPDPHGDLGYDQAHEG